MIKPDFINAAFEAFASLFVMLNVIDIWKKKIVAGATFLSTTFFWSWGLWNLYFYPHLDQLVSGVWRPGLSGQHRFRCYGGPLQLDLQATCAAEPSWRIGSL